LPTQKMMPLLSPDFRDLLCALSEADARFLIVGGYAVAAHGRPRATKDLDVWVEASPENAPRVLQALRAFGAPLHGLTERDLATPEVGLQIGFPPQRIDVLTRVSGVLFEDAWPNRVEVTLAPDLRLPFVGLADLLQNKRAAGRPQDLADVAALERLDATRRR
jgi:hypothetical protein